MPLLNVAGATDRAQEMTREGLPTLAATTTGWASLPGLSQNGNGYIYIYIYIYPPTPLAVERVGTLDRWI